MSFNICIKTEPWKLTSNERYANSCYVIHWCLTFCITLLVSCMYKTLPKHVHCMLKCFRFDSYLLKLPLNVHCISQYNRSYYKKTKIRKSNNIKCMFIIKKVSCCPYIMKCQMARKQSIAKYYTVRTARSRRPLTTTWVKFFSRMSIMLYPVYFNWKTQRWNNISK